MIINIGQGNYVKDAGDTAGIRMVVHTGTRMPFPEDEGITISPGHSTSIGLQKVELLSLNKYLLYNVFLVHQPRTRSHILKSRRISYTYCNWKIMSKAGQRRKVAQGSILELF